MSAIPLLPDTAPFAPEQRAWLNGFFSGLMTIPDGEMPSSEWSASGTMTLPLPAAPEPIETPWHDPAMPLAERLKLAEDKEPELQFMAAMAQLDCGTCSYDCRRYGKGIADGTEKDLTRCSPGGRETLQALRQLAKQYPPTAAAGAEKPATLTISAQPVQYDRNNPFPARFIRASRLSGDGSSKDVRHVVVDIKGSGISYRPGDSLGVLMDNCPDLCDSLIGLLNADGSEHVQGVEGGTTSLRDALLREYAVRLPTAEMVELLIRCALDAQEKSALEELLKLENAKELEEYEIADLLQRYPSARPTPADFVLALSPLQPRLYSISSSQRAFPDEVHLTVGVVRYTNSFGRACRGVASGGLGERMRPGQRVRVFVHHATTFTLPTDDDAPVIMIGPGTGVAPFRAFLQERRIRKAKGMNWLVFGDQHEAADFLYRTELKEYEASRLLTRLDVAFSRDQGEKVYVQHRLEERGASVWDWIISGAFIYVCGDARRMAADVDSALTRIAQEHGNMDEAAATQFIRNLATSLRYLKDVY